MNNDTSIVKIIDLDEKRNKQRVAEALNNLLKHARNGKLKCAAIRLHYKDGTSVLKVIGGTPEEQAETIAKLEAEEAKGKAVMEELRPTLNEVFAHLPEHDRGRVGESPERMRRALNTLSEERLKTIRPLIQERFSKYKTLMEKMWPAILKI